MYSSTFALISCADGDGAAAFCAETEEAKSKHNATNAINRFTELNFLYIKTSLAIGRNRLPQAGGRSKSRRWGVATNLMSAKSNRLRWQAVRLCGHLD